MTDNRPYQFEPGEPLQDDSDYFEESGIIKKVGAEPGTLTGVYVNSAYFWPM